jgi:hypothetical protein
MGTNWFEAMADMNNEVMSFITAHQRGCQSPARAVKV